MKTRTNQPVFLDNGQLVDDGSLGKINLYKHTIGLTGVAGYLYLYTTSDKKFTAISQIIGCINFTQFAQGIFFNGSFSGPTSLVNIIGTTNGLLVGLNSAGTNITNVSITSATSVSDVVSKLN